jgi:hypothetical protein
MQHRLQNNRLQRLYRVESGPTGIVLLLSLPLTLKGRIPVSVHMLLPQLVESVLLMGMKWYGNDVLEN